MILEELQYLLSFFNGHVNLISLFRYEVSGHSGDCSLSILETNEGDSGQYEVLVVNKLSQANLSNEFLFTAQSINKPISASFEISE